jgi:tetratricopeptide (TPR) repeat protein
MALSAVGWCETHLGAHREALAACEQALPIFQELDDDAGEAATWDSLGYVHHHLGHHREAAACYQRAIALYRHLGDRYLEADTLTHLGDTRQAAGDVASARDAWRQALAILDELAHPDADEVRAKLVISVPPPPTLPAHAVVATPKSSRPDPPAAVPGRPGENNGRA